MVSNQTDFKPSSSTPRGCSQINTKLIYSLKSYVQPGFLVQSDQLSFVLGASKRKTLRVLSHLIHITSLVICVQNCVVSWRGRVAW